MSIITNQSPPRRRRPDAPAAGRPRTDPLRSRRASTVAPAAPTTPTASPPAQQHQRQLRSAYVRLVKPAFDRCLALTVLAIMSVPMTVIALAVRVTMGSPVLFRQERIGLHGEPFTVLKFRTMHPDRRGATVPVAVERRRTHKSADDPRHTPVGRFLRKWSLDELPQLINVTRGEMSIIGPRPELVSVVASYTDPTLHDRHLVRPGLTGLWQVSARGDGLMHENGGWDIEYVRTVSFRTDLKILAKTPVAMLADNTGE